MHETRPFLLRQRHSNYDFPYFLKTILKNKILKKFLYPLYLCIVKLIFYFIFSKIHILFSLRKVVVFLSPVIEKSLELIAENDIVLINFT